MTDAALNEEKEGAVVSGARVPPARARDDPAPAKPGEVRQPGLGVHHQRQQEEGQEDGQGATRPRADACLWAGASGRGAPPARPLGCPPRTGRLLVSAAPRPSEGRVRASAAECWRVCSAGQAPDPCALLAPLPTPPLCSSSHLRCTPQKELPPVEQKPGITQTEDILNSILPPRCVRAPCGFSQGARWTKAVTG